MTIDFDRLRAPFLASAISWRAQKVIERDGAFKALALAYIDARDVMERLDEVCGPALWQRAYPHAEGKTVCSIGIKVGDEWIWKADGAGDTDIEAEKGALSAAFKRAAVSWGIGRDLYDVGDVWVPCEAFKGNDNKLKFKKFTDDPLKFVRTGTYARGAQSRPVELASAVRGIPAADPVETAEYLAKAPTILANFESSAEIDAWLKAETGARIAHGCGKGTHGFEKLAELVGVRRAELAGGNLLRAG